MDSSSGALSNSSGRVKEVSDKMMDQRKRKRMISNRDSARRSRARKQKHLDDLVAEVAELREKNRRFLIGLNATARNFLGVDSENAVLRAQVAELTHRLQSLEEIACFLSGEFAAGYQAGLGGYLNCSNQPMMMAAEPGFL